MEGAAYYCGQGQPIDESQVHHYYPSEVRDAATCEIKGTLKSNLRLVEHGSQCSAENRIFVDSTLVSLTTAEGVPVVVANVSWCPK